MEDPPNPPPDFEDAFKAIRTTTWAQSLLCLAIAILGLTPTLQSLYDDAVGELYRLGQQGLDAAAVNANLSVATPEDDSGETPLLQAERMAFAEKLGELGFVGVSADDVDVATSVIDGQWAQVSFSGPIGEILDLHGLAEDGVEVSVLVPDYAASWPQIETQIADLSQDELVDGMEPALPPSVYCEPAEAYCTVTIQLEDDVRGGGLHYLSSDLPVMERRALLDLPDAVLSSLELPAVRMISGSVIERTPNEAIDWIREAQAEEARHGVQAFGVSIGGALSWSLPFLVLATALFLQVQSAALATLSPNAAAIRRAFVAPLLEGPGGFGARIILVIALPIGAQVTMITRGTLEGWEDWVTVAAVVATAIVAFRTFRILRGMMVRAGIAGSGG